VRLVGRDRVHQPHALGGVLLEERVVAAEIQAELAQPPRQPPLDQHALRLHQVDPRLAVDQPLELLELARRQDDRRGCGAAASASERQKCFEFPSPLVRSRERLVVGDPVVVQEQRRAERRVTRGIQ
jgi:hypothetical protein